MAPFELVDNLQKTESNQSVADAAPSYIPASPLCLPDWPHPPLTEAKKFAAIC